jgi:hypothetical protein
MKRSVVVALTCFLVLMIGGVIGFAIGERHAAAKLGSLGNFGVAFTYSAELANRASGSEFFWLLMAALSASPLWLVLLIPDLRRVHKDSGYQG